MEPTQSPSVSSLLGLGHVNVLDPQDLAGEPMRLGVRLAGRDPVIPVEGLDWDQGHSCGHVRGTPNNSAPMPADPLGYQYQATAEERCQMGQHNDIGRLAVALRISGAIGTIATIGV